MKLSNARILITGGSKGLGKATAALLAQSGAKLLLTASQPEPLQSVAQSLGAEAFVADMAKPEDIQALFAHVEERWGGLDVLINNAGIGGTFPTLEALSLSEMEQVYRVNVFGVALATQAAVKFFKAQDYGHIVNIASTAGVKGFARGTIYSGSKFALRSMTQCWQDELRPHNIRVMLVNPSEVPTAFGQASGEERPQEAQKLSPQEIAHTIKSLLEMDDRGFVPEVTVFATNPWKK